MCNYENGETRVEEQLRRIIKEELAIFFFNLFDAVVGTSNLSLPKSPSQK